MNLKKVAAIQMNSSADIDQNLATAQSLIATAANQDAELIVLPEMFICIGTQLANWNQIAEPFGSGKAQDFLRLIA